MLTLWLAKLNHQIARAIRQECAAQSDYNQQSYKGTSADYYDAMNMIKLLTVTTPLDSNIFDTRRLRHRYK